MKIVILVDNQTKIDRYLLAEPALSFYIENDDKKILFDCGYSDVFIQNALKLGINLKNITDIVFSHGHNDHTGGIFYLKKYYQDLIELSIKVNKPTIIGHTQILEEKTIPLVGNIGFPLTVNQLSPLFNLTLSKEPLWFSSKLCFLGEIPIEDNTINSCIDDSALVYNSSKGLFIITGCAHSGIVNIANYAKKVFNTEKIYGILGGMHLIKKTNDEIEEIGKYLQKENLEYVAPCHCCNLNSKIILSKYVSIEEICVGDFITV